MSKASKMWAAMVPWPKPAGGRRYSACHFCDTLHEAHPVEEGAAAVCQRCGVVLYQNRWASMARASAFSLAGLILMSVGHLFPFLTMDAAAMRMNLSLWGAAAALMREGAPILGMGILIFTVLAPYVLTCGMIYVCLPLMWGHALPGARLVAKWMYRSEQWNMVEVFLLGVLVSLLKIAKVADVTFGVGFWAFTGVMLCMAGAVAGIDREELWDRLEVAES